MKVNNLKNNPYSGGSEWRKWDLHVHTPETKLNDCYRVKKNKDVWDEFLEKIEQSDVEVFGITDYFSADGYKKFIKKYRSKCLKSKKEFFLNIELRLNESVNQQSEEVNIHLIFNPSAVSKVDKFLNELKVVKTREDQVPIKCSELKTKQDYESATTTRSYLEEAFENTFGKKAIRRDHFLVFTATGGLRAKKGIRRKEVISDEIDKFSDGFFGGIQNQEYFLKTDRLEEKGLLIGKKPVISGSDAHSFDDLDKFLGRRFIQKNKDGKEIIIKDVTWIKADPTFEGLKQILYEPEPAERIWIGPVRPDEKNPYQVIKKIKFSNTKDFPEGIEFNQNLCSIIGSRSSGKTALLAYIAHAVDEELTESLTGGPGEGEEFKWEKIKGKISYTAEWANGLINNQIRGNIVFIPQNYLLQKSKDSDEIKRKIEPILFKKFPDFKIKHEESKKKIDSYNKQITDLVGVWFRLACSIEILRQQIKNLGDKKVIKKEKDKIEQKINSYKKEYSLSEEELKNYQDIKSNITELESEITKSKKDLENFQSILGEEGVFQDLKIDLEPDIEFLPQKLIEKINDALSSYKSAILKNINKITCGYKKGIVQNTKSLKDDLKEILEDNKVLIAKYEKNKELEKLVSKVNEYKETLKLIKTYEDDIKNKKKELGSNEVKIEQFIQDRKGCLENLKKYLIGLEQGKADIKFDIEYGIKKEDMERVSQKVNRKEETDFVKGWTLQIESIREKPEQFLEEIYSEEQKINSGYEKEEVVIELLTLTETILFVGEMEGDQIGGFSETTMTPGRRALFLLKLILAESDDKWPILLDQPEDNLDSRSITDEIVPFLKKKKRERQIIMVSHNANLVIGADSEQIIVANRNGKDRPNEDGRQFNYLTGSIENTKDEDKTIRDTLRKQGIREHACLILDGGEEAFEHRRNKYNLIKVKL